ncbi:MAG: hypothetical protein NTX49_03090 [Chlamydiae bacterium]|nr:hypothetical protein [Chlamydiota bacterium]
MAASTVSCAAGSVVSSIALEPRSSSTKMYVGNDTVFEVFKAAIARIPPLREKVEVLFDPLTTEMRSHAVFGRDLRVTLLDGSQLIPYPLKQEIIKERMQSWFPVRELMGDVSLTTGFGFDAEFEGKALQAATAEEIPHIQGQTTIEGGNCFVFQGPDGRPKAIIGINSLITSLLSLEEQGYFTRNNEALTAKIATIASPSDEFLIMARDRHLFEAKAALEDDLREFQEKSKTDPAYRARHAEAYETLRAEYGPRSTYKAALTRPLSAADRASFNGLAKELQAKWEMGKELIAHELKIPFEEGKVDKSLAVIFQKDFHIDLEMFVSQGKVFINDETLVHETCLDTRVARSHSVFLEPYTSASEKRLATSTRIKELNARILAGIGAQVAYVPGSYPTEGRGMPVNFMNGIPLEEGGRPYFITFGASDRKGITDSFQESFADSLTRKAPDLQVIFLDNVCELFDKTGGGLHCMTWEKR